MGVSTIEATGLRPGHIVLSATLAGTDVRQRVTAVTRCDVTVTDPARGTRQVYPTVRAHFGGESRDYAPDSTVQVLSS